MPPNHKMDATIFHYRTWMATKITEQGVFSEKPTSARNLSTGIFSSLEKYSIQNKSLILQQSFRNLHISGLFKYFGEKKPAISKVFKGPWDKIALLQEIRIILYWNQIRIKQYNINKTAQSLAQPKFTEHKPIMTNVQMQSTSRMNSIQ